MGLLAAAAVLSFAFGEIVEGGAIVIVILINAVIGFVTELRAVRSMEALQELSSVDAKVRAMARPRRSRRRRLCRAMWSSSRAATSSPPTCA